MKVSEPASKVDRIQTYVWEGRNKRGLRVSGEMGGVSQAVIQAELKRQNIEPLKVKKKKKPLFANEKKVSNMDVVVFTRHLATMICAGLPLVQALDIIGRGHEKIKMQKIILQVKNDVSEGKSLSEALHKHPTTFDPLFCNLVRTAEMSGTLDVMLKRIANYLEKSESLRKKIKKAMTYPIAILSVSFIISAILLIFVVPQFEKLFSSYGAELPAFTRFVLNLSQLFTSYWYIIFGAIALGIYTFRSSRKRSQKFREFVDRTMLKITVFGPLLEKAIIARTTRTLATTLAAGVPLVSALGSVVNVAGNTVYRNAYKQIRDDVETGQNMHISMTTTHLFPSMVTQMVAVGEESGSLEDMLDKIATFYEEDVDNMVSSLSSLLEPLIMLILGVIIGGFVLSMYLPIFKLGSVF